MMSRSYSKLGCLLVLAGWAALGVQPARAQVGVITVQSVDSLLGDVKYVLKVAGREDLAKSLDGVVATLGPGGKGLTGLDTKRPLGAYINLPKQIGAPPTGAIFIPVTKDTEFLDLVTRMGGKYEKEDKGVYKMTVPQQEQTVYVKFANNYAYASDNTANLEGTLPNPATIIPASHKGSLLAASFRVDQVPADYKQFFLSQIDEKVKEETAKKPGESDAEHQGRQIGAKAGRELMGMLVEQAQNLTLSLQVDQQKNNLALDLALAAKPGSQLATGFKSFGAGRSMFSGWVKDSAFNFLAHLPVAGELRDNVLKLFEQAFKEGLKNAKGDKEREIAEKLYKAVLPTLKSEALDFASVLHGPLPDGKYVSVTGIKVTDGRNLEKTLLDILKEVPASERKGVKISNEKIGDVAVHLIQPEQVPDENAKKAFGNVDVRIAFLDNAIVISVGEHGKEGLTKALTALKSAADSTTAPVQFEAALSQLAPLAPEDQDKFREAAKKVFAGDAKNKDRVRLSLQGGDALRIRFDMNAEIVKLLFEVSPLGGG
jgi:hypothetical protein